MSKLDTLDPYVTDQSEWTQADYEAEFLARHAAMPADHPMMSHTHHRLDLVAKAYAQIACPRPSRFRGPLHRERGE